MTFIKGIDRNQLLIYPNKLGEYITSDNPVRRIDKYVDSLNLQEIGFQVKHKKEIHTSAFNPATLVKLVFYGFNNKIKSSRQMAIECTRNIEIMWLIKNLHPSYRTIAYFRAKNKNRLRKLYKRFIKEEDLFAIT